MELPSFSKFKLQLLSLISETRDQRESEQRARENLQISIQKQKQSEVDFGWKIQELQEELVLCNESRQKLESKVRYLQNDNAILETKQKELKGTIVSLLHSKDTFIRHYEDSTCELKHCIETRDRKLVILSQKLQEHLKLFDSIEKEVSTMKQVMQNVECLVSEKEQVAAELKKKMDKISTYEKDFVEKIFFLEHKLENNANDLRQKSVAISELKEQLEDANIGKVVQPEAEELKRALSVKEEIIQSLNAENQALRREVQFLEVTLVKIQEHVTNISVQDQGEVPSALEVKQPCVLSGSKHGTGLTDETQIGREGSQRLGLEEAVVCRIGLPLHQECSSMNKSFKEEHIFEAFASELVCSPSQSGCSDHQSTAKPVNISTDEKKVSSTSHPFVLPIDSESSSSEEATKVAQA